MTCAQACETATLAVRVILYAGEPPTEDRVVCNKQYIYIYIRIYINIYIYIYIHTHVSGETTCLTLLVQHVFFRRGEQCTKNN